MIQFRLYCYTIRVVPQGGFSLLACSLTAELISLLLLLALSFYSFDRRLTVAPRPRLYQCCLLLPILSILLNLLSVGAIVHLQKLPVLSLLLCSLYFLVSALACSCLSYYLMLLTLEYIFDRRGLRRIRYFLVTLNLVFVVLLLVNLSTGLLFYFDRLYLYHRGPLNAVPYLLMLIQLGLAILCFLRHRASVTPATVQAFRVLPLLLFLLAALQLRCPWLTLNGTMMAFTNLLLFICLQSRRSQLDSLTGLGTRNRLYHELSLLLAGQQHFQLVLVSLRRFSGVNQRLGHRTGDLLLTQTGRTLEGLFPQGRCFRFGNVDFVVLLPYLAPHQASSCLSTIREQFDQPQMWQTQPVRLHARFAQLVCTGQEGWDLPRAWEYVECAAKLTHNPDQPQVIFNHQVTQWLDEHKRLEDLVRLSIAQKRFAVWYQPIFDCAKGRFTSAEALLRLNDLEGRPVSPGRFIPLAEETGLIDALGWIVLEETCRLLSRGTVPGLETVSVNFSMEQLAQEDLPRRVLDMLDRYQVAPSRLKIEITERVLSQDMERTAQVMRELAAQGVRFYLDDFGTGWSNLSCMRDLPFQCIKLDHSLLSRYPADPKALRLIHGAATLIHEMGTQVLVEGVESPDQADALHTEGVDWLQGFLLARPMPAHRLPAVFEHPPHFS